MSRITSAVAAIATVAAVTGVSVVVAAPANAATTGCTPITGGQQYLSPWGDDNTYVRAYAGSFTGSTTPWRLSNAYLSATDNAPANVTNSPMPGALVINPGGSTTSTGTCVQMNDDRIRFFFRAAAGSSFKVTTTSTSSIGSASYTTSVNASSNGWQLSPAIMIPDWTDASGTQTVRLTVTNTSGAPVTIDDVLVDPWRATRW